MPQSLECQTYDSILKTAVRSAQTLYIETDHALNCRASTLAAQATVGLCAAEIYTALAYAQQYLHDKPWLQFPDRKANDQQNFAMMAHYVSNDPFIGDEIPDATPGDHYYADMGKVESTLVSTLKEAEGLAPDVTPRGLFRELACVVRDIFYAENPGYEISKPLGFKGDDHPRPLLMTVDTHDLMIQQTANFASIPALLDEVLIPFGCWPLTATQLLLFACDLEQTILQARQNPKALSDDEYVSCAEMLRGDFFNITNQRLDQLHDEVKRMFSGKPEGIGKRIAGSTFPMAPQSAAASALCLPYVTTLPDIIRVYQKMMEDFFIILERA